MHKCCGVGKMIAVTIVSRAKSGIVEYGCKTWAKIRRTERTRIRVREIILGSMNENEEMNENRGSRWAIGRWQEGLLKQLRFYRTDLFWTTLE